MSPSKIEMDDGPQCCDWCGAAFRNYRFASQHEADCPARHRAVAAEANRKRPDDTVAAQEGHWLDVPRALRASGRQPFGHKDDEGRYLGPET